MKIIQYLIKRTAVKLGLTDYERNFDVNCQIDLMIKERHSNTEF